MIIEDWSLGRAAVLLVVVVAVLVANHYWADSALLSGFLGSVIGALATVLSTASLMKHSTLEAEKQRMAERESEYVASLRALKAEVQYNVPLSVATGDYSQQFSTIAWDRFWGQQHRLDAETAKLLGEGYRNATCFGRARELMLSRNSTTAQVLQYLGKVNSAFTKVLAGNGLNG